MEISGMDVMQSSPKGPKAQWKKNFRLASTVDQKPSVSSPPRMSQGFQVPSVQSPPRRAAKQVCLSPSSAFRAPLRSLDGDDVHATVRGTRITVSTASRDTMQSTAPRVRKVLEYTF